MHLYSIFLIFLTDGSGVDGWQKRSVSRLLHSRQHAQKSCSQVCLSSGNRDAEFLPPFHLVHLHSFDWQYNVVILCFRCCGNCLHWLMKLLAPSHLQSPAHLLYFLKIYEICDLKKKKNVLHCLIWLIPILVLWSYTFFPLMPASEQASAEKRSLSDGISLYLRS